MPPINRGTNGNFGVKKSGTVKSGDIRGFFRPWAASAANRARTPSPKKPNVTKPLVSDKEVVNVDDDGDTGNETVVAMPTGVREETDEESSDDDVVEAVGVRPEYTRREVAAVVVPSRQDRNAAAPASVARKPVCPLKRRVPDLQEDLSDASSDETGDDGSPISLHGTVDRLQQPSTMVARRPSSTAAAMAAPPAVKAEPSTSSGKATATTSSTSISTYSSSRRIIENGRQMVTNSDSESADSDDDSDDSLPTDFLSPKRPKTNHSPEQATRENNSKNNTGTQRSTRVSSLKKASTAASSSRKSRQTPRSLTRRPSDPSPPRPVYKYSLAALALAAQEQESSKKRLEEAEAAFQARQREREEEQQAEADAASRERNFDLGMTFAGVNDSYEGDRIRLAVERTEALLEVEKFYYFDSASLGSAASGEEVVWKDEWVPLLPVADKAEWEQVCLSGLVAELIELAEEPLHDDLCRWMVAQLLDPHTDEELCKAYVRLLQLDANAFAFDELACLSSCYRLLGSTNDRTGRSLEDSASPRSAPTIPPGLQHVLRIIPFCCNGLSLDQIARSLVELALANIDENIKANQESNLTIQAAIREVTDRVEPERLSEFYTYFHRLLLHNQKLSLELRCRVIAAFPATTTKLNHIRRWLALYLLTEEPLEEGDLTPLPLSSLRWFNLLVNTLNTSPIFHINESADYELLPALVAVLDIAIDQGFGVRPAYSNQGQPTATTATTITTNPISSALSDREQPPAKPPQPVFPTTRDPPHQKPAAAFNARIDALSSDLRYLASRIRDGGASMLKRTEAKCAIETLAVRLETGVRTRLKARKAVFGRGMQEQRALLRGFLSNAGAAQNGNKMVVE